MEKFSKFKLIKPLWYERREAQLKPVIIGTIVGFPILILCVFAGQQVYEVFETFWIPIRVQGTYYKTIYLDLFWPLLASAAIFPLSYLLLNSAKQGLVCGIVATLVGDIGSTLQLYLHYVIDYGVPVDHPAWMEWWLFVAIPHMVVFFLAASVAGSIGALIKASRLPEVSTTERMILDYIIRHNNKIQLSKCAEELGISKIQVEKALSGLQQKGLVKMKT